MKVCIYTNGGGEGVLATDAAESLGLELPETPRYLKERLKQILPSFASVHNPIDTTAQAAEDQYLQGLKVLLEDRYFDAVLAILLPQLPLYSKNFPKKFVEIYNKQKPIVFVIYGGFFAKEVAEELENIVPVFESPIQATRSLKLLKTILSE
ncbi:MAG TPA: hypothetical protein EYH22_01955 [Candidatus Nanopusillus sp.]|nr:hypothetical protein [Candidatus Nanopusillus sp.]